ncbi:hypothetical protein J6590_063643 [Homalodisca vitripennis]|nr:hypothetical protein J6590_063643 [Homalodisca vitripennis]
MLQYNIISIQGLGDNWDKPQRYRKNPKSLVELAADVLDRQPLPDCMYWGIEEVINWLQNTVKLPQYKKIQDEIRKLYQVPRPTYARDLTLPSLNGTQYDWNSLYYRYIARQSPHRAILRSEYWRMTKMMNAKEEPACHWLTIATGQDIHDKVLIARVQSNPYRQRYYMPMFRENHYTPTTILVYYLDGDPLTW